MDRIDKFVCQDLANHQTLRIWKKRPLPECDAHCNNDHDQFRASVQQRQADRQQWRNGSQRFGRQVVSRVTSLQYQCHCQLFDQLLRQSINSGRILSFVAVNAGNGRRFARLMEATDPWNGNRIASQTLMGFYEASSCATAASTSADKARTAKPRMIE